MSKKCQKSYSVGNGSELRAVKEPYEEKICQLDKFYGLVLRSLISQRLVLLTVEETKEISCCQLCAFYLLFDLKRLPRRLHFINDQIVENDFWYCWLKTL